MKKEQGFILPIIIVLAVVALLGTAGYFAYMQNSTLKEQSESTACTLEAKVCPDGSAVGRTGLNCEFAECPTSTTEPDETAGPALSEAEGWKTYINTQYGYEIKYPADWKVTVGSGISSGQGVSLSLGYSKDVNLGPVNITVYPNQLDKTIVQDLKTRAGGVGNCQTCGEDTSLTALSNCFENNPEVIKIDGKNALQCNETPKFSSWQVAVSYGGYIYYIGNSDYSLNQEENNKEVDIYNLILSTFRFIEEQN